MTNRVDTNPLRNQFRHYTLITLLNYFKIQGMNISVCAYDYMGNCVLHSTTCLYFATVLKLFLLHNRLSRLKSVYSSGSLGSDQANYDILIFSLVQEKISRNKPCSCISHKWLLAIHFGNAV